MIRNFFSLLFLNICFAAFTSIASTNTNSFTILTKEETIALIRANSAGTNSSFDVINVKAFGAVGDGTNDDTEAISLAFSVFNSPTNYRSLYFPPGRYRDTGIHYVSKAEANVNYHSIGKRKIMGDGYLSLIQIENQTGPYLSCTNSVFDLADIILYYYPGPSTGVSSGVAMFGSDSMPEILNVTFYRFPRYGLFMENQRNPKLYNVWVHQCYVGAGFGRGVDGLYWNGRMSGNSIGCEFGAIPENVLSGVVSTPGGRMNGNIVHVTGYGNDVGFLFGGSGDSMVTTSGHLEGSRTFFMIGHLDRSVWTPATAVDDATLRTPAVGYVEGGGMWQVETFRTDAGTVTNINGIFEIGKSATVTARDSYFLPSTGKTVVNILAGGAGSILKWQNSGIPTLTTETANYRFQTDNPGYGLTNFTRFNPNGYLSTTAVNPGFSLFQDTSTVYGSWLSKNQTSGRWRYTCVIPSNADFSLASHTNGVLPTESSDLTDWFVMNGLNGFVGLGTLSPTVKLDVTGDIKASGYIAATTEFRGKIKTNPDNVSSTTDIPGGCILFDSSSFYAAFLGRNLEANRWTYNISYPTTADFMLSTHTSGTPPEKHGDLTTRFVSRGSDGFVGIKKASPTMPLDVNGTAVATEFGSPTNSTPPSNTSTIRAWINWTNSTGGIFKVPLYQ